MQLEQGEYKIKNDGIWISKAALEEWKNHYSKIIENSWKMHSSREGVNVSYHRGRLDVLIDLLKMFEPLEG